MRVSSLRLSMGQLRGGGGVQLKMDSCSLGFLPRCSLLVYSSVDWLSEGRL